MLEIDTDLKILRKINKCYNWLHARSKFKVVRLLLNLATYLLGMIILIPYLYIMTLILLVREMIQFAIQEWNR